MHKSLVFVRTYYSHTDSIQETSMTIVVSKETERETEEKDTIDDMNSSTSSMANESNGVSQIATNGDDTTLEKEESHKAQNIAPASSYEQAMKIVLQQPAYVPSAQRPIMLEKSLSETRLECDEENYYDKGNDLNTVAEIKYKSNKNICSNVSWNISPTNGATSEGKSTSSMKPESNDRISVSEGKSTSSMKPESNDKYSVAEQRSVESRNITRKGSSLRESGTYLKSNPSINRVNFGDEGMNGGNMENATVSSNNKVTELAVMNEIYTSNEKFQDEPDPLLPQKNKNVILQMINSAYSFIFPKLDPVSCFTLLALTIFAAIPAVLYILAFTRIGYGLHVFSFIYIHLDPIAHYLGAATVAFAMFLYLMDCYHWSGDCGRIARHISVSLLITLMFCYIFALSAEHPYGPVGIFLVATTSWMEAVRLVFYSNITSKRYISWLSGPLLFVSQGVALYWFCWTLAKDENEWNTFNNLSSAVAAGCKPNFDEYPQCDEDGDGDVCFTVDDETSTVVFDDYCPEVCTKIYDSCLNSFIIWGGPFLVSVGFFFLSVVASFLRGDGSAEQNIAKLAHSYMFLLFSMWISSCLAGAGTGIATTLTALTFSAFAASAVFLIFGYNSYEREEHITRLWDKITKKYGSVLDSIRGLLIITSAPIGLIYIFISFVRQFLRNLNCCWSTPPPDTMSLKYIGGAGWVTVEARRVIRLFRSWDRAKVFTYAIYWGTAFMILSVIVAEFSILFLSYTIEKTSDMNIALVTVILSLVGMIMFLLPPVPGVPIYLTLGIVIVPVGRERFGITGSIFYALIVSLCLKLTACTLQQKMIGGLLQHKVGVRQFVGINSKLIRSMKLVLREKGFGIAKVAILIGGPDWPTSVLCGIMDLPLIPILAGTLPVILLILPTLLTGSFTYMSSLVDEDGQIEFPWAATMATVAAAITGIVQFGSMIVAAYYVEKAVSTREEELKSLPIDQEVKEADDKLEEENKRYSEVTQWHRVPILAQLILYLSLICMILSCYMVQLFSDDCFAEYDLTYTIDEHLDGEWTNLVKPLGLTALILFSVSLVLLKIFTTWAMRKALSGDIAVYPERLAMEYTEKGNSAQTPSVHELRTKYVRS